MKSTDAESDERRDKNIEPQDEEMKDPMSGYASADTIASGTDLNRTEGGHTDKLEDPMSGYASADAVATRVNVNRDDVDKIHIEELKDSMSGYASADALERDEE